MDIDQFPLIYPRVFELILLHCDPGDLLACRATCSSWSSWFSSSASIWTRFVSKMLESSDTELFRNKSFLKSYRLRKLLEHHDTQTEGDCLKLSMKLSRMLKENSDPEVSQETMKRVKKLESIIPVMGPPAIFIRVKVNHPIIKKIIAEMLSGFLGAIILDRQDALKEYVKSFLFQSMYVGSGQNYVYVDNLRSKEEEDEDSNDCDDDPEGFVLEGEDRLSESLKMSLQSSKGEKRRNEEDDGGPSCKRAKGEDDGVEDTLDEEENEGYHDNITESNTIYETGEDPADSPFPTLLDLLEIDNEVVQSVLIDRCRIDRIIVIPQFERFLDYLPVLQSSGKTIVGCDSDGKVNSINPDSFGGSDNIMIGAIDTPTNISNPNPERLLEAWAGRDKRLVWPEFAKHLEEIDKVSQGVEGRPGPAGVFNPVVMSPKADENKEEAKKKSSETAADIFASLAERGISVVTRPGQTGT